MQKQKGMTLIGMLLTVVVVVISLVVVMRIIPVYLQYYSIYQSIKSLNTTPASSLSEDPTVNVMVLKSSLVKRLDINGVDAIDEKAFTILPNGPNKYKVTLKYQVIRSLVYNINLLFIFDDVIEVIPASEI